MQGMEEARRRNAWDPKIAVGTCGRCHESPLLLSNEAVAAPLADPKITT